MFIINRMVKDRTLQKLGDLVRQHRQKLGISQEELGARAGLDRTYVGGIERGERNCTILKLVLIARALEVRVHQLLKSLDE